MSVSTHLMTTRRRGFSLIEVMIVVAIVAILAAVAYPSYTAHVRKGRRADAQTVLLELAQQLEQHYARANSYATFDLDDYTSVVARSSGYYTFQFRTTVDTVNDASLVDGTRPDPTNSQGYRLKAVRTGTQTQETVCGDMAVTAKGGRFPDTVGCWR